MDGLVANHSILLNQASNKIKLNDIMFNELNGIELNQIKSNQIILKWL